MDIELTSRFRGLFLIGLFIVGILAVGVSVQATFTLGDLTGTAPYHANDFDPHVPGVIGYVWPGSGECAYLGYPNQANTNGCVPGHQAPYPSGNRRVHQATLGTSSKAMHISEVRILTAITIRIIRLES